MTINIEFDKVRLRSLLAIPTIGIVLVGTSIALDPVTLLAGLGLIVACVKYDQVSEEQGD